MSTTTTRQVVRHAAATILVATCAWGCAAAAGAQAPAVPARPAAAAGASDAVVSAPANYVIGPDDVLTIVFWRDKDLSGDVAVRPDLQREVACGPGVAPHAQAQRVQGEPHQVGMIQIDARVDDPRRPARAVRAAADARQPV